MTKRLSNYFSAVAAKVLSAVEVDTQKSNQHEFNGSVALKAVLGGEKAERFPSRFLWLGSDEEVIDELHWLTWYDARERHPTRSEWRLYFPSNAVMERATPDSLLLFARRPSGEVWCVLTDDQTVKHQLLWLFDLEDQNLGSFREKDIPAAGDRSLGFAENWILEALGIEPDVSTNDLDIILDRFGPTFPKTAEFSALARELQGAEGLIEESDATLLAWLQREEAMFRELEKHLISERLQKGFTSGRDVDVDGFISFSLGVQNRRKSRAGHSLENHVNAIFQSKGLVYERGARTENQKRPDFLFPGTGAYHDPAFPASRLLMLGAKSSCKDRWRQVLSEASRIDRKHLLTLEPGISRNQTDEMAASNLQLVVPRPLFATYDSNQQKWLSSLTDFIDEVIVANGAR
ncbi:MAG: type II restriction endonuclease [Caulobacterales bacterium]|uniref:type II restriction endonuclease n=1 Tax=Glycocaulis sp. TaxID=1969725 RepID=UPI003F9EDDF3